MGHVERLAVRVDHTVLEWWNVGIEGVFERHLLAMRGHHEGSPGMDNQALHRIDVSTAIGLIEEAGFVVEAQTYMLNNPADDHTLHPRELERNTDRLY